jgi:hypothetical protein
MPKQCECIFTNLCRLVKLKGVVMNLIHIKIKNTHSLCLLRFKIGLNVNKKEVTFDVYFIVTI